LARPGFCLVATKEEAFEGEGGFKGAPRARRRVGNCAGTKGPTPGGVKEVMSRAGEGDEGKKRFPGYWWIRLNVGGLGDRGVTMR